MNPWYVPQIFVCFVHTIEINCHYHHLMLRVDIGRLSNIELKIDLKMQLSPYCLRRVRKPRPVYRLPQRLPHLRNPQRDVSAKSKRLQNFVQIDTSTSTEAPRHTLAVNRL